MSFFHRCCGCSVQAVLLASVFATGVCTAQDYSTLGISDVVGGADRLLQRGDYRGAIPALEEVVRRTQDLTDPAGRETLQTCRFQLARSHYQVGDVAAGMAVLQNYLDAEPRKKERLALRMMAQGFFEVEDWDKIQEVANRLLAMPDLEKEDRYNANLLLGQALFRQEKWAECVGPLSYAADHATDERTGGLCQIMAVRALVESESWKELFGWIPRLYRTDSKYDITLNLTLMKAGKARFEEDDYLNALLLYRMVLPRQEMLDFSGKKVRRLSKKLVADRKVGISDAVVAEREKEIGEIKESMTILSELPPYEDEVTLRIGQIYAEVKRYWEAYVLFDRLYANDRSSEIGEAAMLQSVLILYDVGQVDRAEERILRYLDETPDGKFARTLLTMMSRDNLMKKNFDKVISLKANVERLSATDVEDEKNLEADVHYMTAFGYFQKFDYASAGEQFTSIVENYPNSPQAGDARYFRGMTFMMRADYAHALEDFLAYQKSNQNGEHYAASMFREAVCLFGLAGEIRDAEESAAKLKESEVVFTRFIETNPNDVLVSEAYSMRGDIEAAKEATNEDPYTLDRALADYRQGIDTATTAMQASYPAFQAAKVYKLEFKWQDIIDLMNYYMDRWEEMANVSEAVYWIGQSQIELGEVNEAIEAYLEAIERFGNDPEKQGVDKIISELVKVSNQQLADEEREALSVKLKFKLTSVDDRMDVLKLRLQVAQALLAGEEAASALGDRLISENQDLKKTTPASLALMCDSAVTATDTEQMQRLYDYFFDKYEESDELWHACRAKTYMMLANDDDWGVLKSIDEAQGMFGAEEFMGWAQLIKAQTLLKMKKYEEAEEAFNMVMGVPEWRGPIFAESMYGMGMCRMGREDLTNAHAFFQRTYLLFKSYSDGEWAAKGYLAAADCLQKLGKEEDAVKTLKAMLEDVYTNTTPQAELVREQLKKLGVQ
ncbi:tetratricopeptide repeat protein [Pontiella sulfatireligans]|uniref:Outer membrane protein assembly factor BamD n=1 Tax=Pontiella sulfatireligans TaxID=2750658 RepID=A0A6C2UGB3_9BACT|nr:tetratricopeptide repeat protein [Pontiella sulfatireligans]VGO19168.1 hypothetical protein SCARR_01225 [Pontiella sulfatireligans]